MAIAYGHPSAYDASEWTNPTNGYSSDDSYATVTIAAKNTNKFVSYTTYGISGSGTITQVRFGLECKVSTTSGRAQFGTQLSTNGGTNYDVARFWDEATSENLTDTTIWYDATADRTWTWTLLNNTNFKLRVFAQNGNSATSVTYSLDDVIVEVTYTSTTTYTIDKNSNARFKALGLTIDKNSNARFKALGLTIDKNSNARFSKAGLYIDKTSDALFAAASLSKNIDKTSDARFSKSGLYIEKNSNARFAKNGQTIDKNSDARFAKNGQTIDKNSDARFAKNGQTIDKNSNARFAKTLTIDKTSDAYFGTWTAGAGKSNPEWLKIYG